MNASILFEHWRQLKSPARGRGLAWFLANEFCKRYYSSHGIVPCVIAKEGLGYYGIQIEQLKCSVHNTYSKPYGRLTMAGDVENWRRGSPGDHGLLASDMCAGNVPTEEIVQRAIEHMEIDVMPPQSHLGCRHKRWGASYELCFEISTILVLRSDSHELRIWNDHDQTARLIADLDPKAGMKEHPGAFLYENGEKRFILSGDGRLLDGSNDNFWTRYMHGASPASLAELLAEKLYA